MFTKYITSFIDGRIRVRHKKLRDPNIGIKVKSFLQNTTGVKRIEINAVTGSLLMEYDPEVLRRQDLLQLAEQLKDVVEDDEDPDKPKMPSKKSTGLLSRTQIRKITNMGMIITLSSSVALGLTGRKVGHVTFGWGFLFFNAIHLFMYRKSL